MLGGDVTTNNANGIQTDGSSGSNTVTVQLTNRLQGTGSTVGAVTTDLVTFALGATPGTFTVNGNASGFEATTPAGASYNIIGGIRTTGAAAALIDSPDSTENEDAALVGADVTYVASGNNLVVRATGVAGLTIQWSYVGYYVFAG